MTRRDELQSAFDALGIPVVGLGEAGPKCRIDFAPEATDEQRAAATKLRDGWDWSEPLPLKSPAALQQEFLSAAVDARQAFWDLCLGDMILEWCVANPERAAKHAADCGFKGSLREEK